MNPMKRFFPVVPVIVAIALIAPTAFSQDLTDVNEIVKKANHSAYYKGKDGRAKVKMTIKDAQGRERNRELTILRKNMDDKDEEQRFYVYFHQPADVRDTVFMVHKHVGKDDDRWLYLPALDVVKRIAASDERTSFVGSHFFYEDVSGRGIEEDNHELIETTQNFYVLKNTPKNPQSVEFDSYKVYVHKGTFLPIKAEYEKNGKVYRVMEALEVKEIQGYPTVVKMKMSDTNIGGETILEYSDVKYDIGLSDDIFTERYLRKPPREYLK